MRSFLGVVRNFLEDRIFLGEPLPLLELMVVHLVHRLRRVGRIVGEAMLERK